MKVHYLKEIGVIKALCGAETKIPYKARMILTQDPDIGITCLSCLRILHRLPTKEIQTSDDGTTLVLEKALVYDEPEHFDSRGFSAYRKHHWEVRVVPRKDTN